MSLSSPSSASAQPPGPRWTFALGQLLLWLVLALSLFKLPAPMSSDLDPSWRMAVGHMVGRGFQWGTDVVFTYGPLGHLLAATNHGEHYTHFLLWQLVMVPLFATAIWWFGRRLHGWRAIAYYAYFLGIVAVYIDAMHLTMILLLALGLLREPPAARRWLPPLLTAVLAVLSLVKFTNLMLAGFCIACVGLHHAWQRRWLDGALVVGSYGLWFATGWLACDQHLANIPTYLLTSLASSSGYTDGMSLDESGFMLGCGLTAALGVVAYYLLNLWRRNDFASALAAVAVCGAASFLNWKHGYARADSHVLAHFVACLFVVVTCPVLLADNGTLRRLKAAALALAATASLVGIVVTEPNVVTDGPAILNYSLKNSIKALARLPHLEREANEAYAQAAQAHALPKIREIVGNDTIDMIANSQGYVVFNGLNYRPRPLFQSYLPYTAQLLRLNERFLQSERAPKYLLLRMDTIDRRLPALEDSLSLRQLMYHYRFVEDEAGFALWRRAEQEAEVAPPELVQDTSTSFGTTVPVPALGEHPVWMELDLRPTLLGRLRSFLYKLPLVNIAVTDTAGFKNTYRLIPAMAGAGCFISPSLTSAYNIRRYVNEGIAPHVAAISVEVPPHLRRYYQPAIAVRFYRLPPIPRGAAATAGAGTVQFSMFDRAPTSATAHFPLATVGIDGRDVLAANPPSEIEFLVNFPASKVSGQFGIAAGAYEPPAATDGADFIIEWIGPGGDSRTVFTRTLRPMTTKEDRGIQDFSVSLPPGGGRLILRITPGPNGDPSYDWTYWTGVRFTP